MLHHIQQCKAKCIIGQEPVEKTWTMLGKVTAVDENDRLLSSQRMIASCISCNSRRFMTPPHLPPYFSESLPGNASWPIGLAHRGADIQRENTMSAVRDAVELGFSYIEVDVQTSADDKVVVFHDDQLDRITTGRGKVCQYTWNELATLKVLGPQPRKEQVGERLVLMEELLEAF